MESSNKIVYENHLLLRKMLEIDKRAIARKLTTRNSKMISSPARGSLNFAVVKRRLSNITNENRVIDI